MIYRAVHDPAEKRWYIYNWEGQRVSGAMIDPEYCRDRVESLNNARKSRMARQAQLAAEPLEV